MQKLTLATAKEISSYLCKIALPTGQAIFGSFLLKALYQQAAETGCTVWQDGVVILYHKYGGDCIQIDILCNTQPGNGAMLRVWQQFMIEIVKGRDVMLHVQETNYPARHFYEKVGMQAVGASTVKSSTHGQLSLITYRLYQQRPLCAMWE